MFSWRRFVAVGWLLLVVASTVGATQPQPVALEVEDTQNISQLEGERGPNAVALKYPCLALSYTNTTSTKREGHATGQDGKGVALFQDGYPFTVRHKGGPPLAVVCLNAKVASTRFKVLQLAMATGEPVAFVQKSGQIHNFGLHSGLAKLSELHGVTHHRISSLPTFTFVRNPYSRVLSAYLQKFVSQRYSASRPGAPKSSPNTLGLTVFTSFQDLLEHLVAVVPGDDEINVHFAPLSRQCGLDNGAHYDFVLKLEDIDTWYFDYIKFLDAEHLVQSSDWGPPSLRDTAERHEFCFHVPPGSSCKDAAKVLDSPQSLCSAQRDQDSPKLNQLQNLISEGDPYSLIGPGLLVEPTEWRHHSTDADAELEKWFTPERKRLIEEAYRGDFEMFGYPMWTSDGPYLV